ncbi:Putative flippase GtrA (transmembrane translocase of bactoprenol-linked glucose) [Atopostipes suicloacalis DSM 15692]|uniref:Putative flippase GtrA (Transmembrane translocase of bactoprenol-linked glucose) n=1 Tax=Atopostipes suicloacalis DSM 15692 TaxID=1121025 RepID=A0A1M4XT77_9LACT|nr:GtrA family protein [Atopostipes suicloacalis]SHE96452.1 Putative flippase GtrA (transmembrane translocase of bactoprenol-linked glucose) [Atopostipes suicloacalis DSM 15692]
MKNKILDLYYRYREIIDYIFFGGLTTLVNIVVFFIFDTLLSWPYLIANAIAIILSILFAYVTNKLFVFKTSSNNLQENIYEFIKFIGFRLLSGLADMLSMWVLVDLIFVNTNVAKLLTQFIVVVLNYVFSKFFIFL